MFNWLWKTEWFEKSAKKEGCQQKKKSLNNREQVIKRKELELDETTQKLATSKVYILNLEKKINELENSTLLNRQTSTVYLQ